MLRTKCSLVVIGAVLVVSGCTVQPDPRTDEATPVAAEEVVAPNTLPLDAPSSGAASTTARDAGGEPPSNAAHHAERASEGPTIDPVTPKGPLDDPAATGRPSPEAPASSRGGPARRAADSVREITIPVGTPLTLRLDTTISSRDTAVEEAVNATLERPVVVNGTTIVPAGVPVTGVVTEAVRAGRVKGLARVGVRFTTLRAGSGRYRINTAVITREAQPTKKEDATKIGIGAGAGAITGAIAGGKKGAAIGTAVGAGGGTAAVLATRGDEAELARGSVVTTRLTAPVTLRVP